MAIEIRNHLEPDDFASRYGGEEFAVICIDKPAEDFQIIMEKIRKAISVKKHTELSGEQVTVSIGIQSYVKEMNKEDFFEGADLALYTAKRNGKNQTVVNQLA